MLRMGAVVVGVAGVGTAVLALVGFLQKTVEPTQCVLFFCLGGIMFSLMAISEALANRPG